MRAIVVYERMSAVTYPTTGGKEATQTTFSNGHRSAFAPQIVLYESVKRIKISGGSTGVLIEFPRAGRMASDSSI